MPGTRAYKVVAYNHETEEEKVLDNVEEAMEHTGESEYYIRESMRNPHHYSHHPERFSPETSRGTLRTKIKRPRWEFEKQEPIIVTLIPTWEGDEVQQEFPSHYAAYSMLEVSTSTYYAVKNSGKETIKDRWGREWIIIFHD